MVREKPTPAEELKALEKQLAAAYLQIADSYKRMSKVSDDFRLSAMQESVDYQLKQTLELRLKITALRKYLVDNWRSLQ